VGGELENDILSGKCLVHSGESVQLVFEVVLVFAVKEAKLPKKQRDAHFG